MGVVILIILAFKSNSSALLCLFSFFLSVQPLSLVFPVELWQFLLLWYDSTPFLFITPNLYFLAYNSTFNFRFSGQFKIQSIPGAVATVTITTLSKHLISATANSEFFIQNIP